MPASVGLNALPGHLGAAISSFANGDTATAQQNWAAAGRDAQVIGEQLPNVSVRFQSSRAERAVAITQLAVGAAFIAVGAQEFETGLLVSRPDIAAGGVAIGVAAFVNFVDPALKTIAKDVRAGFSSFVRSLSREEAAPPSVTPPATPTSAMNFGTFFGEFRGRSPVLNTDVVGSLTIRNVTVQNGQVKGDIEITGFPVIDPQSGQTIARASGTGQLTGTIDSQNKVTGTFNYTLSSSVTGSQNSTNNISGTLTATSFAGDILVQGQKVGSFTLMK